MNYLDLANCGKWFSGNTPTKNIKTYWGGNIPWISASSMNTDYIHDSSEKITDIAANEYAIIVPQNSIIILVRGSTLLKYVPICLTKKEVAINQDVKAIVANEKIDPFYLFYSLKAKERDIYNIVEFTGIGAGKLSTDRLKAIQVFCPNISIQKKVASFFKTLDDKIELNRRMNETLESIARAIFKSWFIDFDPVRTKAETRQPEGIDAATAALFPSDFETVEGQEIPKGWKISTLGEHIESVKGLSYKGDGLCSNGIPLHNLNSVLEGGGYKYYGIKYYSGEYKERHILKNGDIIVANTEQGFEYLLIGYPAIIPNSYDKINLFSHHLFRVRPFVSSPCKTYFIYHLLMSPAVREQIIGCTNGTTVNMLKIDGLIIPKFVLPSTQLIDKFDDIVSLLYNKIEDNVINSRNLEALRDTLLPKLLSGELPIENPEQFTGVS
jgi:type I restriction enzyme S subunit